MVGPAEWLLIFGAILILFGPNRLPEVAQSLGEATRQYKNGLKGVKSSVSSSLASAKTSITDEDRLLDFAKTLKISTKNRSIEDIAQEILNHTE